MFEQDQDDDQRMVFILLGMLLPIILGIVIGVACYAGLNGDSDAATAGATHGANNANSSMHNAATVVVATTAAVANTAADEAKVVVENGVVKFYFATGKADIAKDGNQALADVIKGVKAGQKAVVSGYHDSTGNLVANQELAKQRAVSVRDAMVALGASADAIELKKPENSEGSGNASEARRVEVVLSK